MQTQQLQQNKNTLIIKVSKENVLIKFLLILSGEEMLQG